MSFQLYGDLGWISISMEKIKFHSNKKTSFQLFWCCRETKWRICKRNALNWSCFKHYVELKWEIIERMPNGYVILVSLPKPKFDKCSAFHFERKWTLNFNASISHLHFESLNNLNRFREIKWYLIEVWHKITLFSRQFSIVMWTFWVLFSISSRS